jgi:hypothetical protein
MAHAVVSRPALRTGARQLSGVKTGGRAGAGGRGQTHTRKFMMRSRSSASVGSRCSVICPQRGARVRNTGLRRRAAAVE